jgi:tetratricopeptide (TPR) repeat protein
VSLLLDALRKAEQQKQQLAAQEPPAQENPASGELELELVPHGETPAAVTAAPPPAAGEASPGSLPELPKRLEDLDEQFMAHASLAPINLRKSEEPAAPPKPAPAATPSVRETEAARAGARLMFEAKQPAEKRGGSFAIAAGILGLVAAAGIGGYVWWEMQPKGGLSASGVAPARPAPPPAPIASAAAPAPPPAVSPEPTLPAPAASETVQPPPKPPAAVAATKPAEPARPAPALPSPIRVSKAVQKTDPLLEQAHASFERGELDLARAAWEKVLAADPRNTDALHGLAAVALQRQQADEAADHYLRALEADPKDALALAGLLSLKAPANAQQAESRLKLLLAEQPDSPYLNFALGNLYARDARWADAQQAYFKAHTADAANPDYLFNLAVSLDQLHQPRLAIQYYNQAIAAAARQPAGFDAVRAAARLKELQAGQP